MKYYLYFKTPDVIDQVSIHDEDEREKFQKLCKKYLMWSECITVCFDTEKMTATIEG